MPTYTYECGEGHPYEEVRAMSDPQQREVCPKPDCAKSLRRKFESSSILFKGRGFYSTGG